MYRHVGHILAFLVMVTPLHAEPNLTLLDRLAQELKRLRSLPVNTPTNSLCPEDRNTLVDLRQEQVLAALEEPDYIDKDKSWTYFFTSPLSVHQRGGGFPQLTFVFNQKNLVTNVTCYYSR